MKAPNKRNWRAVYTKPRSEKKVAERLEEQGIEVYCPTQITLRQWSDRKKKVSAPGFPSYVFVKVGERLKDEVLQDPGVMNYVYWLGRPAVIRDEEIEEIRSFLGELTNASIEVHQIEEGQDVKITAGPLKGTLGNVERVTRGELFLHLKSLGMIVKAKVRVDTVTKIAQKN